MSAQPREFYFPFLRKEQRTRNTVSFYFDRSHEEFDFTAGQYIRIFLDLSQEDPRGNYRSFSICSSPEQQDILMITTKIKEQPSVFKQKLLSLNPREKARFFGPMGAFVFPEQSARPLVFLAGGIGITPLHSMLLHAAAINYHTPITLLISFSTVEEMVFYDELAKLGQEHPTIKIVYTITHPEESPSLWNGETGRISSELIKKFVPDVLAPQYFVCGPSGMVAAMLDLLQDLKVPPNQVKEEQFTGY